MVYLLALPAVALPVWLLVQTMRGRVQPYCCAGGPGAPAGPIAGHPAQATDDARTPAR